MTNKYTFIYLTPGERRLLISSPFHMLQYLLLFIRVPRTNHFSSFYSFRRISIASRNIRRARNRSDCIFNRRRCHFILALEFYIFDVSRLRNRAIDFPTQTTQISSQFSTQTSNMAIYCEFETSFENAILFMHFACPLVPLNGNGSDGRRIFHFPRCIRRCCNEISCSGTLE